MERVPGKRLDSVVKCLLGLALAWGLLLAVGGVAELIAHAGALARGLSRFEAISMRRVAGELILVLPALVSLWACQAMRRGVRANEPRHTWMVIPKTFAALLGVVVLEVVATPTSPFFGIVTYGKVVWLILLPVPLLLFSSVLVYSRMSAQHYPRLSGA